MAVSYTVKGETFVADQPRVWLASSRWPVSFFADTTGTEGRAVAFFAAVAIFSFWKVQWQGSLSRL